jgi:hypothetical protein
MKTLEEVMIEVQGIINQKQSVETLLLKLRSMGYKIEYNWIKNGTIGTVFYMKRKSQYRIQVSASEKCGKYHKAFCIVIPTTEVWLQLTEQTKVRNIPISRKPERDG